MSDIIVSSDLFVDDFAYPGERIYLNNASISLMPKSSIESMREFLLDYNSAGPDSPGAEKIITEKMHSVRSIMAGIISCQPDEVILTQSTTDGINIVAGGLAPSPPHHISKYQVIIRDMEHEHHANLYPWFRLKESGMTVRSLPIDQYGFFDVGGLRQLLDGNGGRASIVAMSHALYNTGAILPIEEIGRAVRNRATDTFFVDSAQTIGCLDVSDCNVARMGCDYMSFNGSKWLCGPMGIGFLYCSKKAGSRLEPCTVGGESAMAYRDNNDEMRLAFRDMPDRFQTGFRNYVGTIGIEASLRYLKRIGFEKIRRINRNLSAMLVEELARLPDVVLYSPDDPDRRTSIVSFNIRGMDPRTVVEWMEKQGIVLAVREMGELEMVRASPHFFNTESHIQALVDALKGL